MNNPTKIAIKVVIWAGNKIGKIIGRTAAPILLIEMYRLAAIPTFASDTPFSVSWLYKARGQDAWKQAPKAKATSMSSNQVTSY